MKTKGNYHPTRVNGQIKFARVLTVNKEAEKSHRKKNTETLDLTKPDWSIKSKVSPK